MPPKVRKANAWMKALKKWNSEHTKGAAWCVPRKNTPQHQEVKDMMSQFDGKKRSDAEQAAIRHRTNARKKKKR